MNIQNVKKVFHALTIASAALAALSAGPLPAKVAIWVTLVSSAMSGLLHLITTVWPDAAKD